MSPTTLLSQQLPSLSYTSTPDRFDETWSAPLSTLLGLGRAAGADLVEFFLERTNYINCLAEDDAITSITPSLAIGAGVRVFRKQADCYVSTNDLSFSGLKTALEKALSILGLTLPSATSFIPEINLEMFRDYATKKDKDLWLPKASSMTEISQVLLAANSDIQKKASHIQSRRAVYFRDCKKFWWQLPMALLPEIFASPNPWAIAYCVPMPIIVLLLANGWEIPAIRASLVVGIIKKMPVKWRNLLGRCSTLTMWNQGLIQ
jgi:hypothetical protein